MKTDKEKESNRRYMQRVRSTPEGRAKLRKQQREFYLRNPDAKATHDRLYAERHKEDIKNYQKYYYYNNKAKYKAYKLKRLAAEQKAMPSWANIDYMNLWYKLAKLEQERTGREVHVDHIVPLRGKNVCGLHCEDNMQLLFAEDNRRKSNLNREWKEAKHGTPK